jgi:uncharacterized membrane protein
MVVASRLDSVGNFTVANTGILDEVTSSDPNQYSVYFGGSGNYLSTPSSTSFDFSTGDFTLEAWIYPIDGGRTQDSTKYGTIISQFVTGSITNSWGWAIGISAGGVFDYMSLETGGTNRLTVTGLSYAINTWHHVACVRYNGTISFYINGVSVGSASYSSAISYNASASVNVGRSAFVGAFENWLKGYISNLRVVKGTAVYKSNFIPSKSPLTAIPSTVLLTCQNASVTDNSTNAFTITKNGTATIPFIPPQSDFYAATFNGSSQYISMPAAAGVASYASDFTIEFWFYANSLPSAGNTYALASQLKLSTGRSWRIQVDSDGYLIVSGVVASTAGAIAPNIWYHVAWTKNSTANYLFINGVLVNTAASSTPPASTDPVFIGATNDSSTPVWHFPGKISNFRIVKGTALYTSTFKPDINLSPVSGTSVLALQNSSLVDNSTNRYAITNSTSVTSSLIRSPNFLTTASQQSFDGNHKVGGIYDEVTITPSNQYASVFDGSSQYLNTPSNAAFTFGTGDFTIECWVNGASYASNRIIVDLRSVTLTVAPWILISPTDIRFNVAGTQYISGTINGATLNTNQWYHVAAVRSSGSTKLYVNGVQVGSTYTDTNNYVGTVAWIGGYNNGAAGGFFSGYISNFRIVKGTAVYTSNFTASTTPLTAIPGTSILTCQNSTIIDNSPNAFTITNNGTVGTYNSPYPAFYAANFSGSNRLTSTKSGGWLTSAVHTVEAWIYLKAYTSPIGCIAGESNGTNVSAWEWTINSTDYGISYRLSGTQNSIFAYPSITVPLNTWNHVAFTRDSANLVRLFLNGVQVGSGSISGWTSQNILSLGYLESSFTYYLNGYISNFRIVNGVALYTGNFTPSTSPLKVTSNTSFLTCNSPTIVDQAAGATITNTGSVSVLPAAPFTSVRQQYSSGDYLVSGIFDEVTAINESYSASFNGTGSQYLTFGTTSDFKFLHGSTSNFTIECWIYPTSVSSIIHPTIFATGGFSSDDIGVFFGIGMVNSGDIGLQITKGDSINYVAMTASATAIKANQWQHVALTFIASSKTYAIYVNGISYSLNVFRGTQPPSIFSYSTSDHTYVATIGRHPNVGATANFSGNISNFRIVKGIAVYTQNFTPPVSQLTAIPATSLLTCQSSTFVDNSPNAFTITNTGSVTTYKPPYSPFYAAAFDGTFKYLNTPSNVAFNFGTGDFTIELWAYKNTSSADDLIITNRSSVATTFAGDWWIDTNSSQIRIQFKNNSSTQYFVSNTGVLNFPVGQWFHLAVVKSGSTIYGYLNGISFGNVAVTGSFGTTGSVYIGAFTNNSGPSNVWNWNGYISNVRIVKGVAVYASDFTPPTVQLTNISGTSLLTCQSPTIIDNSTANAGAGFTITNTGPVTVVPREPF